MSVCCHCSCACCHPNATERPSEISEELDQAAHLVADAMGEKVFYARRGKYGGGTDRVYVGGGGAIDIPTGVDCGAFKSGCYTRSVKVIDKDHTRPYISVSFEVNFMPVETAEALMRWLFNRE